MSKFSKQRSMNTNDFAKLKRQSSGSNKLQNNIDKLILASKLAASKMADHSLAKDMALDVDNVYNCEIELTEQKNEIEGKKELDTIEKFVEPNPPPVEEPPKRIFHLADVVLKIRNQGFLERIKRLKELRDKEDNE